MPRWMLFAPLLLGSCAAAESSVPPADGASGDSACTTSAALESFVGQPASAELGSRLMAASRATKLRWVPYGAVITMDYSPNRLTVRLDQQNRIISATCG